MKDEIKEILDRLERIDHKEYIAFEFADTATFDKMARCFEERKKLADYIIKLNNQYDLMENSLDEKQEVIDKAIEYIKANRNVDDYGKFVIEDDKNILLGILTGCEE